MRSFPVGSLASLAALASTAVAWMPSNLPLRGVNLGTHFIDEPWINHVEWAEMGCGDGVNSEFDCVMKLGQETANTAFKTHWDNYIVESEFDEMLSYGLNTIRIPIGYWLMDDIVDSSEHFPRGGLENVMQVCGWASDRGMYIILELHGAPGAQVAENPFTGQFASTPGFYNDYNYDRATQFLTWITNQRYDDDRMRNVGMIGVVNEPTAWDEAVESLRTTYYPNAYNAIRDVESSRGIGQGDALHVAFMNTLWGAGDPKQYLPSGWFSAAFEDHRYLKWDTGNVPVTHDDYIRDSCTNDRSSDGEDPTVVTEWSISPPDDVQDTADWATTDANAAFYSQWFAAAVTGYERSTAGWTFWTWKTELGDYRWGYRDAVNAGIIPRDLSTIASSGACDGY